MLKTTLTSRPNESLAGVFKRRCQASPDNLAWHWFDREQERWQNITWGESLQLASRWQQAFRNEGLTPGDRVAIMLSNSLDWVICDQAALGMGLVVVPVFTNDRPDNVGYILQHAGVKVLLTETRVQVSGLIEHIYDEIQSLRRVVCLSDVSDFQENLVNLTNLSDWLPEETGDFQALPADKLTLATIVYTSGTTGRPKGVMLSHWNIMSNVMNTLQLMDVHPDDMMLSFLPLSHMLERMAGYYLPVFCGSQVSFARSITTLAADMETVKPTILISVPQVFEMIKDRVSEKLANASALQQFLFKQCLALGWRNFERERGRASWSAGLLFQPLLDKVVAGKIRARTGGRLRLAICGGAALAEQVSRFFVSLGIHLSQGYGLTETSPVLTVNLLNQDADLKSVGRAIPGVELKVADNKELLARGDNVMLGYWKNQQATESVIQNGWFHTGDKAVIEHGYVFITGRIKEIIVLSSGEKVPPYDMEQAIRDLPMIHQVMIVGEARPYLSAVLVLDATCCEENYKDYDEKRMHKVLRHEIQQALHDFPGYAKVRRFIIAEEPWTVENGFLTPTMKLKRQRVEDFYDNQLAVIYES